MENSNKNTIKKWLITNLILIIIIIIVGGTTRLTQSGLSMVHWEPIKGVIPPLNNTEWEIEFLTYQQYPEYKVKNNQMTLSEFKVIFFWEYLHRLIARIIGLTILIPLLWFWVRNQIDYPLVKKGLKMFFLVLIQGIMGWYMVKSGLVNNPQVSHFRLAAHLSLAFLLFAYILRTLCEIYSPKKESNRAYKRWLYIVGIIFCIQLIYGAFTAGLKAGYMMNTFPKMGNQWVADEIWAMKPIIKNLFYNPFMIQLIHRVLGIMMLLLTLGGLLSTKKWQLNPTHIKHIYLISGFIGVQFLLGVLTLLSNVNIPLALGHQLGALMILSSIIIAVTYNKKPQNN